jgi:hypothetical protein
MPESPARGKYYCDRELRCALELLKRSFGSNEQLQIRLVDIELQRT